MNKLKVILADDIDVMNQIKKDYLSKIEYIDIIGIANNGIRRIGNDKKTST